MMCPHFCGVDRLSGNRGKCGATDEMMVARVALHFWEEPPISGEAGSGTIFFAHCPLKCVYCQNSSISRGRAGRIMTKDELSNACLDLQNQGAMNINFVTPTHYAESVRNAIGKAQAAGLEIPIIWNTSGYESVWTIRSNRELVDVYLTDFKYMDNALAKAYSGISDYAEVATAALDEMVISTGKIAFDDFDGAERMTKGVIVRHLLLPGHLDDSKRVVAHLHERYGSEIRISLMNQYTPLLASRAAAGEIEAKRVLEKYPNLGRHVSNEDYEELLDYADEIGVQDYFWQNGETAEESFIPDFNQLVQGS